MRIEYETTLADLKAWAHFMGSQPKVRNYLIEQRCWKAAFVAFPVFIVLFLGLGDPKKALGMAGGTFVALVLGMWFVDMRQSKRILQWQITRYPALAGLGRRTLEIGDDRLTESSELHSTSLQWPLIDRIVYQPGYLYFILLNQSGVIVPLDAIQPATDRERFLDFLRRCAPPELRTVIPEPAPDQTPPTGSPAPDCAR
jgi:hypothetical protein